MGSSIVVVRAAAAGGAGWCGGKVKLARSLSCLSSGCVWHGSPVSGGIKVGKGHGASIGTGSTSRATVPWVWSAGQRTDAVDGGEGDEDSKGGQSEFWKALDSNSLSRTGRARRHRGMRVDADADVDVGPLTCSHRPYQPSSVDPPPPSSRRYRRTEREPP